jgi:hypothetical protein
MTTPVPAPVPAPPAPPAQNSSTASPYIHAEWMDDFADIVNNDVVPMLRELRTMDMCLAEQQAGRTQISLVRGCLASAEEILMFITTFVDRTDERFAPLFEEIDAAGGLDEVAKQKRYHDASA